MEGLCGFLQDAWLDNIEVDTKLASSIPVSITTDDDNPELSLEDIGKIKRRIADSLHPGETVSPLFLFISVLLKISKTLFSG